MLWLHSYLFFRRRGELLPVDTGRDVNLRYFADVLRQLLRPALHPAWGDTRSGRWRFGWLRMHRKRERVGLFAGDLTVTEVPPDLAAMIVVGNVTLPDHTVLLADLWCTGDATVGKNCLIRTLAADGSAVVGPGSQVDRWVDAAGTLRLGDGSSVIAAASAGQRVIIEGAFRSGTVSAPVILTRPPEGTDETTDLPRLRAAASHWLSLRQNRADEAPVVPRTEDVLWIQPQAVTMTGDFWSGPGTVLLHDVIGRRTVRIGDDCIVAGSIHAAGELQIGRRSLIFGSVACSKQLVLEADVTVTGSVHVDGDAVVGPGARIGLDKGSGGLAATGSVRLDGPSVLGQRLTAGKQIST